MRRAAPVCLVTTVREPGPALRDFVRWHQHLGVDHVFVFFDDPDDPGLAEARALPGVTALACDEALRARQAALPTFARMQPYLAREVMARQVVNAELAVRLALARGAGWLLHLDVDELLLAPRPLDELLATVPAEVGQIVFRNHEAMPARAELDDPFREVTLFKRNPETCPRGAIGRWRRAHDRRWFFLAYENGKAAVRLAADVRCPSVHVFQPAAAHQVTLLSAEAAVLHYVNCGFPGFLRKYRHRGAFSDAYFDRWPRIPFHLQARDVVARGDAGEIRAFYERHVLCAGAAEADALLAAGIGLVVSEPATWLGATVGEEHAR